MKQTIISFLFLLGLVSFAFGQGKNQPAQPKCSLPLDRAPELRGFRLGLAPEKVLARFPGTSLEKPDKFGLAALRLTVIDTGEVTKGLPTRDKGVQADISAGPGEGSAFIMDSAKFPALKGVRRIQLRFIDGRVSYVQVAYDDSIKWNSIDEFVETVAKTLNLPSEWRVPADSDGESKEKELRCEGFVITASVGADAADTRVAAQLSVEDLAASKALEKRQNDLKEKAKREEEDKRKNFKP